VSTASKAGYQAAALAAEFKNFSQPGKVLCDGFGNGPPTDRAENTAWYGWSGPRLGPKRIGAKDWPTAAAWQCVAACDAVALGKHPGAVFSLPPSASHRRAIYPKRQTLTLTYIAPCRAPQQRR
jgi:hypothetical protein